MANDAELDFGFDADVSGAEAKIASLRQEIQKTLEAAKKLGDSLKFPKNATYGQVDRGVRAQPAGKAYINAAVIEQAVKDRFTQIDNSINQALARVAERGFRSREIERNTTPVMMAVRARLNDLQRFIKELNSASDVIEAFKRDALFRNIQRVENTTDRQMAIREKLAQLTRDLKEIRSTDEYIAAFKKNAAFLAAERVKNAETLGMKEKLNDIRRRLLAVKTTDEALSALEKAAVFSEQQKVLNNSSRMLKVRERLAQLARDLKELNSLDTNIDAVYRAAESNNRIRSRRGSDYYRAREALTAQRDQDTITRSQMGDAAFGWMRRRQTLMSNGGADLFLTQAQVGSNYMLQSTALSSLGYLRSFVVELDAAFKNLQAVTATTDSEMEGLRDRLIEVSEATKFSALEVAEAATTMAQAGLSAQEVADSIDAVTKLATASGTDLASSVDVVTSVLGQFDVRTAETANIANVMTAALNESKLTMEKLALGLQYSGNIAAQAGMSYTELTSILAGLSNAGIRSGSTLGTGIRQLMIEFLDPSKKLVERLTQLGLSVEDVDIKSNGFMGVLKKLSDAGFTVSDAMQTLEVRSANAFAAIANNVDYIERTDELLTLSTASAKANAIQMESLANTWKKFTSTIGTVAYDMFRPVIEAFQKVLNFAADALSKLREFDHLLPIIGTGIASIAGGGILAWLTGLVTGLGRVLGILPKVAVAAEGAAAGISLLGGAVRFLSLSTGFGAAIIALTTAFAAFDGLVETSAEKIDRLRGNLDQWRGTSSEIQSSIQRVDEAVESLIDQQEALDKDGDTRRRKALELKQAFLDLGLTFDETTVSTGDMVEALNKIKDNLGTEAIAALNQEMTKSLELQRQLKNQEFTSSTVEAWLTGKTKSAVNLEDALTGYSRDSGMELDIGPFFQGDRNQEILRRLNDPTLSRAYQMSQLPLSKIDSRELETTYGALSTRQRQLAFQYDVNQDPTIKAQLDLLAQFMTALNERLGILKEIDALKIKDRNNAELSAREAINKNQGFKDAISGQGDLIKEIEGQLGKISGSDVSAEEKRSTIAKLALKLDEFDNVVFKRASEAYDSVDVGLRKLINKDSVVSATIGANSARVTELRTKLKTMSAEYGDAIEKNALEAAKDRFANARQAFNLAKGRISEAKTQKQIEEVQREIVSAFDEYRAAQAELNSREMEKAADKNNSSASREAARNAAADLALIDEQFGDAISDINERSLKLAEDEIKAKLKDYDTQLDSLKTEIENVSSQMDVTGPGPALDALRAKVVDLINKMGEIIGQKTSLLDSAVDGTVITGATIGGGSGHNAVRIMQGIMALGLTKEQAAGLLGAMMGESGGGLNPAAFNPKDSNGLPSGGIAQWNGARFDALRSFATARGTNWDNLDTQIAFLVQELKTSESGALAALKGTNDVPSALAAAVSKFERPRDAEGEIKRRLPFAQKAYATIGVSQSMADNAASETVSAQQMANWTKEEQEKTNKLVVDKQKRLAEIQRDAKLATIERDNEVIEQLGQLRTTTAAQVQANNKKLVDNSRRILDERIKALEANKDNIVKDVGEDGYNLKLEDLKREEEQALSDRLSRNYQIYIEKLKEQFYKESGGQMADARLGRMDSAPEGSVTGAERKSAERAQQLAQENTNRQMSVFLLQQQAQLEEQIAQARSAGNNEKLTELAQKLAIVNQELQQLPANYQTAGAAEENIGKPDTIARLKEVTNQFLLDQGMVFQNGQWQVSVDAMAGYWQQAMSGMQSAMQGLFTNLASGTMSAEDAFRQFALSIVQNLLNIATQVLTNQILAAIFGGGTGGGFNILSLFGMGGGGGVPLPTPNPLGSFYQGTSLVRANNGFNTNRDSVHALLQPGEAVLRKSAVQMVGRDGIDFLNGMGNRRYSESAKVANDNRDRNREQRKPERPLNIWIAQKDEIPPPGPNDVVTWVADNIQRGGAVKQLIKTVASGRM